MEVIHGVEIDATLILMSWISRKNDVRAILQWFASREGKKGVLPHHNDMSFCRASKESHVLWEMKHQIISFANAPFLIDMKNDADH